MKRISAIVSAAFFSFIAFAAPAMAQIKEWSDRNPRCVSQGDVATIQGLECIVANILAVATTAIGLVAFVMVVVGAFSYLLSGGNSKGVEAGKQSITYAIIGIVVALLAYFVLNLISDFTGVRSILFFNLNIQPPN